MKINKIILKKTNYKNKMYSSLILKSISEIILNFNIKELKYITLNRIEINSVYSHAKIFFSSLFDNNDIILKILKENTKNIKKQLSKKIYIRKIPIINFYYDDLLHNQREISKYI